MDDKFGINSIINNLYEKFSKNLPKPVYKYDSFILITKIFGVILLISVLFVAIFSTISYNYNKNKTYVSIKYFKNGRIVKNISKIIDKKLKKKNEDKCTKVFDDENNNSKTYKLICLSKVNDWMYYIISLAILIIILFFIFMPIVNFHYNRKQYFANPYHRTFIEYVIRLFYPLYHGTTFKERIMNQNTFY